jgi:hypothetical protein
LAMVMSEIPVRTLLEVISTQPVLSRALAIDHLDLASRVRQGIPRWASQERGLCLLEVGTSQMIE